MIIFEHNDFLETLLSALYLGKFYFRITSIIDTIFTADNTVWEKYFGKINFN